VTGARLHFLILTGTSGSGKSHALNCLEDVGYFCIDNLPLALIGPFADLCERSGRELTRIALVVDVRERFFLDEVGITPILELQRRGHKVETLFFDADDAVLIQRFSETRRPHPLSPHGSLLEGLTRERGLLAELRNTADRRIDTTHFSVHDLRSLIRSSYGSARDGKALTIAIIAFGYKYGIPLEADLLFDVRFLANPHFVPELKEHTGREPAVRDYVLADRRSGPLLERLTDLLMFVIPAYEQEGRSYLTIGIGCTGGKHRSIVIADRLASALGARGHAVEVRHRDAPVEGAAAS
jgi:RNase adapter protein RapZ